jgi:hypothetical protein
MSEWNFKEFNFWLTSRYHSQWGREMNITDKFQNNITEIPPTREAFGHKYPFYVSLFPSWLSFADVRYFDELE